MLEFAADANSFPFQSQRLVSLDVFRGITIAGMVLVNNPGTWEHIYWPLEHASWHGWTPTDLVFPFFLFIVGVSIPLAFANRLESGGSKRDLYLKIIKRTLIIFAIGLFLNGLPYFGLAEYRIPGVLQRIAVCYFFASIIFLNTKVRTQIAIATRTADFLLANRQACSGSGFCCWRSHQRGKPAVVCRSRRVWKTRLGTGARFTIRKVS